MEGTLSRCAPKFLCGILEGWRLVVPEIPCDVARAKMWPGGLERWRKKSGNRGDPVPPKNELL
jgi:hypothetical protein